MNIQLDNLTVGADPHVRPPDSDTGGNNRVHLVKFFQAVGVFIHHGDQEVSGKKLTVVSMSAEVGIGSGGCQLLDLAGLMLQDKDGLGLIQTA